MSANLNRNKYLEACFFDAYGLPCEIEQKIFKDANGYCERVVLKVRDKRGNIYGIIENYNGGTNETTKNVVLEDTKTDTSTVFNDVLNAELAMVDIIRSR